MSDIKFVFLDLGNVIVNFSHDLMIDQIAKAAEIDVTVARSVVFEQGLQERLETGQLDSLQFHQEFCRLTGSQVAADELDRAAADIFKLNIEMVPVIGQMQITGIPLGILSNTCPAHWNWVRARYSILRSAFPATILSFEVGSAKPDAAIFQRAIEAANCRAEQIFYVDDQAGHVAAAAAVGIRAQQFVGAKQLALELQRLGLQFNY